MQLGTFGAILSFAIELEKQAREFYQQASAAYPGQRLFAQLYRSARKRASRMERTRREGVAEMILESITGLDSDEYQVELAGNETFDDWLSQAEALEVNAQRFYQDAAVKLPIDEVSRIMTRMASENESHLIELRQIKTGGAGVA